MAEDDITIEQEVKDLQQEMIEAMIRGDTSALNNIPADDFIGTNPLG